MTTGRERTAVLVLAGVAALRVAVFASGMPLFHPVDEHQHLGAVVRYAGGELPGTHLALLHPQVARWATAYGTFEYLYDDPALFPPYLQRPEATPALVAEATRAYAQVMSSEFDSPPGFYAPAGAWFAAGRALGLDGLRLPYWARGFNVLCVALLVVVAWLALRPHYPDDAFVRLGVPLLLAAFPQDSFYGVSSDAFAPLAGALAFGGLAAWAGGKPLARGGALLVGLAVALVFLTKYSNAVFVGLLGGLALLPVTAGRQRPLGLRAVAVTAAAVPISAWLLRNLVVIGDLTGTARKVANLEWSPRPFAAWLEHPIFTPSGFLGWLADLAAAFWRGEFTWLAQPMSLGWLDACYVAASAVTLLAVGVTWWRGRGASDATRWVEGTAALAVAGAVVTLGVLSLRFEYADWGTPTRAEPFFHHGRLILGVLLPFALLHVRGIARLCQGLPARWAGPAAWAVLAGWVLLFSAAEGATDARAFASAYNLWNSTLP